MTKSLVVTATRPGVYGHYREEGDVFELRDGKDFSEQWMERGAQRTKASVGPSEAHVADRSAIDNAELEALKIKLAEAEAENRRLRDVASGRPVAGSGEPEKSVEDLLVMANDKSVEFLAFRAAARKLLGEDTPSTKAEIVAALEDKATHP